MSHQKTIQKHTKKIAVLLSVLAILFCLCSCGTMEEDFQNQLEDDVYGHYETMKSAFSRKTSTEDMIRWLETWSENKSIYSRRIKGMGLVMTRAATKGYGRGTDVTYQCRLDPSNRSEVCKTSAIALTALADTREHGKLTVLFTEGNKGAQHVPERYLNTSHFISLTERSTPRLFTGSAATAEYRISRTLTKTTPESTRAFRYTISGCAGGDSSIRDYHHANPITSIGSILSSCRSDGLVVRIASFCGGNQASQYPTNASITLVINSSEADKLKSMLEHSREKFKDRFLKNEPAIECTIEEVQVPRFVYSASDASTVTNLLYTLKNDVYATGKDDNDLIALTHIGRIRMTGNHLTLGIFVRSTNQNTLSEMRSTYKKTAELTDASWAETDLVPLWKQKKANALASALTATGEKFDLSWTPTSTFMRCDAAVFAAKKSDLNPVVVGVTIQDALPIVQTLVTFTEQLGTPSSEQQSIHSEFSDVWFVLYASVHGTPMLPEYHRLEEQR